MLPVDRDLFTATKGRSSANRVVPRLVSTETPFQALAGQGSPSAVTKGSFNQHANEPAQAPQSQFRSLALAAPIAGFASRLVSADCGKSIGAGRGASLHASGS